MISEPEVHLGIRRHLAVHQSPQRYGEASSASAPAAAAQATPTIVTAAAMINSASLLSMFAPSGMEAQCAREDATKVMDITEL